MKNLTGFDLLTSSFCLYFDDIEVVLVYRDICLVCPSNEPVFFLKRTRQQAYQEDKQKFKGNSKYKFSG
jgi:hypothetical protein